MYQIKNRIYLNFDKTQKSGVCNFLRALVKQNLNLSCQEILDKFLEDEKYYQELNASRFPFLKDVIDDSDFLKDTGDYIKECIKYYEYKDSNNSGTSTILNNKFNYFTKSHMLCSPPALISLLPI